MTEVKEIGKWFVINKDDKEYHLLIQGNDLGSIIVFDETHTKIPYKEWDEFEKIMESIDYKYGMMNTVDVVVCYKDGQPKGFMTTKQYQGLTNTSWWDSIKEIEVPQYDWDNEKIHIGNIKKYVDMYECQE
jgi:hypothetical protein